MRKTLFLAACILAIAAPLSGRKAVAQDLALTHATVYASPTAAAKKNTDVLIQNGVITEVGEHLRIPSAFKTVSCEGCTVLAGFWNAHVHFTEPKWNNAAHQPAADLQRALEAMLTHSGFTTIVDTGSDVTNTVALRKRIEDGEISGPRILTAGLPLFPANALPYYIADLPAEFKARLGKPATASAAKAFVDSDHAAGADIIKLFTGSIAQPNHIVPMQPDIASAAVAEAHKLHLLVFSHTTNFTGTKVAIDAGVDVLAHTPEETEGIDDAMLRRLVAQHTTIIPTLKLFSHDDNIAKIRALDFRFHQLGGALVYGTDTGFLPDYDQGEEFRQLSAAGFSFREILAMLTTAPSALFRLDGKQGKVASGMQGDLTILSEDPASAGAEAFTKVRYTIRNGKVLWQAK